jgi:membrane associated rhomboid family serine protease
MVRPDILGLLVLSPRMISQGQVWRLVTYLFIPDTSSTWWILFNLYWLWWIASSLEAEWGAFRFNVYYLVGMLGTTAAALIAGHAQGSEFLNLSLFFAFATLFPEMEILLFFILPIRVKWLGWLSLGYVLLAFATGGWATRAAVIAALVNYLLFFWGTIRRTVRGGSRQLYASNRPSIKATPLRSSPVASRSCAICGAREEDGADIRVCSCEKCKQATSGQTRTLCLEHARSH